MRRWTILAISPFIALQCVGCVAAAPAIFSLGSHDTGPELLAIVIFILVLLPTYVLAFWRRKIASYLLFVAAAIITFGFVYQFAVYPDQLTGSSPSSYGLLTLFLLWLIGAPLGLGIFLLRTSRKRWPEALPNKDEVPQI
jgi:hypothetical protein